MREIPETASLGRRTPSFTIDSVPAGLLRSHSTNAWAELMVTSGSVLFIEENSARSWEARPGSPVVIVPGRPHRVEPGPTAEFYVQFFDHPTSGADADGTSA